MAVKGTKDSTSSMNIINTIRASIMSGSDLTYGDRIPEATKDNLQDIGKALLEYKPDMNQFLDELINRIGLVVIKRRMYKNKLSIFKKGFLEYGDSIEEIFVDIAKAIHYEPEAPQNNLGDVWEQFKPKVVSAFHRINREDTYPVTINEAMLRRAFTGYANFDSFVNGIFDSLYNADEFDEYLLFKQLLGDMASNTYQVPITIPTDRATSESFSIQMRSYGLNLEYMSRKYNQMGVANHTPLSEQILILKSTIVPVLDVTQLANNFNMNLAQPLSGRIIVVDDFGQGNEKIQAMIVDSDFSMIYDTRYETNSIFNPRHLYWNYFLHHHQIISASPFSNAIAFVTGEVTSSINSVVLKPNKIDVIKGTTQQFNAIIDYTGTPDLSVTYKVSGDVEEDNTKATIDSNGLLSVPLEITDNTLTVTVTTTTGSKTAAATVTVKENIV